MDHGHQKGFRMNRGRLIGSFIAFAMLVGCGQGEQGSPAASSAEARPRIAYVTNGVADFWKIAEAGANAAGDEFDVEVEVLMPTGGVTDQKRMLEDLVTRRADGISCSSLISFGGAAMSRMRD